MKKALEELIETKAKELKESTNPEELVALAELVKAYSLLADSKEKGVVFNLDEALVIESVRKSKEEFVNQLRPSKSSTTR